MGKSLLEMLSEVEDYRHGNAVKYRLKDILLVGILALICNMDDFTEMELFAKSQKAYLETFCDFEKGTPSHDTFGDVFSRLNPEKLSELFVKWMLELRLEMENMAKITGKTIAIDGKTIKGSRKTNQKASHIITAFVSDLQLVLGQVKTDEKSNEIKAIPQLLEIFQVAGNVITIDAMGAQKDIAKKIVEKKGDYVFAIKNNHKKEREDIEYHLKSEKVEERKKELKAQGKYAVSRNKNHGRIEIRECYLSEDLDWFDWKADWAAVRGCGMIRSRRQEGEKEETVQYHYFLYSLKKTNAEEILRIKREHWAIENNLHWLLDMAFREDACRARTENAAEVLNVLRKLVLQVLKAENTYKCGIKTKRKLCGLGVETALKVFGVLPS